MTKEQEIEKGDDRNMNKGMGAEKRNREDMMFTGVRIRNRGKDREGE